MRNLICAVAVLACLAGTSSILFGHPRLPANPRPLPQDAKYVVLAGNTRPEANAKNDRGRVADSLPMEHIMLLLRRSPAQEKALQAFTAQLTDPASPNFHLWLTPAQFGARFGLPSEQLGAVTSWLESQGFTINQVYPSHIMIDFSGNAGQVTQAFRTEIHNLDVDGVAHIANMTDPQIPAALAPLVNGIVSLNDFRPHTNYVPRSNYTIGNGGYLVVPADLATIYNLNPLFTSGVSGQGQTIVLIEDTDLYTNTDWTTFRSTFGLSGYAGTLTTVHPGGCADPGVTPDDGEAVLDVEWASAAAPSAALQLASCMNTTTFGGLIALQNLLNAGNPPAIVSISYGACEAEVGASGNAAYNTTYQQAVTEGVSVFVSAGDSAAAGCDDHQTSATHGIAVNGFGSTPYNVSVGGTDFGDSFEGTNSTYWSATNGSTFGSALSYIPEIPWNNSCASVLISTYYSGSGVTYGTNGFCNSSLGEEFFLTTSGGSGGPSACATGMPSTSGVVSGTCAGYAKPTWQTGFLGNPADGVRDLPDVSLFAANGDWGHYYVYCWSDPNNGGVPCTGAPSGWSGAGGTSFASPIMAAIQSLVNQKADARQGNPAPTYYKLAATEYGASGTTTCNSTLGNEVAKTCIFYDVTLGDMDVNCTGTVNCYLPSGANGVLSTSDSSYLLAYGTKTGWDFATGIGTINATNLVDNWPSSGGPIVTLSPTSLTFATQLIGTSSASQTVTLTNTGTASLTLDKVATTGTDPSDFIPANHCGGTITAGSSCTIGVTFKPTASGTRSANLTLTDSATNSPQNVPLTGTGTSSGPVVTLSPTSLTFTSQDVGTSSAAQAVTLTNTGGATLTLDSVTITGTDPSDFISANHCGGSISAGSSCIIDVTFKPIASGTRSADLTLKDSATNSPQNVPLSGTGIAAPVVTLSPTSLTFGVQAVGTSSAEKAVTLTNTGDASLTLDKVTITGTDPSDFIPANHCGGTITAGSSCTIDVTFKPTESGTRSADLTLTDSATNSPQLVPLTGTGGGPIVTLSPTSLTFGSQSVGTSSAAQAVTLTNTGLGSLTLDKVDTTGTDASDFIVANHCPGTVLAGASCTIDVTFKPTATGMRSADLTLTDSAPNSPQEVPLTGTGK